MSDLASSLADSAESPIRPRPELLRALGPGMAMAIVVGNVIGSGIFAKPGEIAANAGNFPVIIAGWIAGGILCILGALCFAELSAMLPRAGGLYVFLREAYGRPMAFLFGFNEFIFGRPASIGALAVYFVTLLANALKWEIGTWVNLQLAICAIVAIAWVNMVGVIWGGRLQGVTTLIKAGFLGFIAMLPFLLDAGGLEGISTTNFLSTIDPDQKTLATQFAAVLLAVMWAYNGWHDVAPVAEEIREPQKNIPRALISGVLLLMALYVSVNVAYHGVLSMQEVKDSGEKVAQQMVAKLLSPFGAGFAWLGTGMMSGVILCSVFGAINSNLLLGPRISFAMGRDDVFVRRLGDVHAHYRTPAFSIMVQATMSSLLVLISGFLVEFVSGFRDKSIFQMMTDYVTFSASIFYLLCVVAVFVLRRQHPEWERPYRTWGYPVVPLVFVASYTWFLIQVYQAKPAESRTGVGLILLGIPVYFAWQWWAARSPRRSVDPVS